MLTLTDTASTVVKTITEQTELPQEGGLRISGDAVRRRQQELGSLAHAITCFTAAMILSTPGSDRTSRLAA